MKAVEIEADIKKSIEKLLDEKHHKLLKKGMSFNIEVNRSGEEKNYFSEIEVTFWEKNNVLDVISVIVYAKGNLRDTKDNFLKWFNEEVNCMFE